MDIRCKVYLAGPDVFLEDAADLGNAKREICARFGLDGLFPLDAGLRAPRSSGRDRAMAIYRGNDRLMADADACIANLTPFRGPNVDDGTAFEVGAFITRGKPVFGYMNVEATLVERVETFFGGRLRHDEDRNIRYDPFGLFVEDYGLPLNLMLACGIVASGGTIVARTVPETDRFRDLGGFERCATALGRLLTLRRDGGGRRTAVGQAL